MRLTLWHAPALLLLYQTAPLQPRLDEAGRFRLGLGYSRGSYADEQLSCDGGVIGRAKADYTVVSGQGDAWVTPSIRISAAGGVIRSSSDSTWISLVDGGFGALLLAREGKKFGIGGGVALWPREPGVSGHVVPSVYLRAGPADRAHFRIDDNATAAPGSPPVVRLGVAGGYGQKVRPRWFLGVTGWAFPGDASSLGFGGELGFPLGPVQPLVRAELDSGSGARIGTSAWEPAWLWDVGSQPVALIPTGCPLTGAGTASTGTSPSR